MRQKVFLILLGMSLASSGFVASAEGRRARPAANVVTTFSPVADATVDAALPNSSLGKAQRIEVDASPQQRSLFRFDLTGLSGQVTQAKLRLFNLDGSGSGGQLVGVANNSWNETTITWNNAPGIGSTAVASMGSVTAGLTYEWDATPLVAGNGTLSMALRSTSSNGADYSSREGPATRVPQLIVTTTPSPSPTPTPTAGPGSTTTFVPVADAFVRSDQPSFNFGTSSNLETDGAPLRRAYLRFSVTGLSGMVTGARLSLLNTDPSVFGGAVHPVANTTWSESGITWNTAPTFSPTSIASFGAVALGSRYEVDVKSAVTGNGVLSLALVSGNSNGADFGSRESGASGTPRLTVTTTGSPAPSPSPSPSPPPTPTPTPTPSPSPTGSPVAGVVVAAAGNIACDPTDVDFNGGLGTPGGGCRFKETSDVVASIGPDAVLPLGDNQYAGGSLANFQSVYDPTWGRFRSISHPAPGNHEYEVPGAADYFTYFGPQAPAPYYSFDLGAWHLISLNSEISKGAGSAQEVWLRQDLASTDKECVLAYWHRPRFSSGPSGGTPTMEPLYRALRDNDVEVLLTAHDHFYERFAPQDAAGTADPSGVRQFVVGTGGKSRHSAQIVKPNSEVRGSAYGALKLTLRQGAFDWRFVAIPTSSFTDSGSDTCH